MCLMVDVPSMAGRVQLRCKGKIITTDYLGRILRITWYDENNFLKAASVRPLMKSLKGKEVMWCFSFSMRKLKLLFEPVCFYIGSLDQICLFAFELFLTSMCEPALASLALVEDCAVCA